nr:helix-turn-helix transcriptional regulator [Azospirillum melinis]
MCEARERAGLTRGDVAKRLHTTEEAVQRLEQGGQKLTLSALLSFADAIGSTLRIEFQGPDGEHP